MAKPAGTLTDRELEMPRALTENQASRGRCELCGRHCTAATWMGKRDGEFVFGHEACVRRVHQDARDLVAV